MIGAFSGLLTMRAEVRRNAADTDSYGGPGKPGYEPVKYSVPCYAWSKMRQRVVEGKVAEVEELEAIFYKDADIQSADRIEQFKNRKGDVVMEGPFEVLTVTEQHNGGAKSHLQVRLRRIA